MPGEIPTSPTTAPPVQVTAVPPRTVKLAADPSATWADADETPPSSAAVASRHVARYLCRLIMICIPISRLKKVPKSSTQGAAPATMPLRRKNFCPVADRLEKIKAVSRRPSCLSCCHNQCITLGARSFGNCADHQSTLLRYCRLLEVAPVSDTGIK